MRTDFSEYLHYEPTTGDFHWSKRPNGRVAVGDAAGRRDLKGYLEIQFGGKRYKAHRLAWYLTHGTWPTGEVDHINGVKDDNRLANLREATSAQNHGNVGARAVNTSGVKGVSFFKITGKWRAQIQGKHLGYFSTKEEASAAYAAASERVFGEFSRLA